MQNAPAEVDAFFSESKKFFASFRSAIKALPSFLGMTEINVPYVTKEDFWNCVGNHNVKLEFLKTIYNQETLWLPDDEYTAEIQFVFPFIETKKKQQNTKTPMMALDFLYLFHWIREESIPPPPVQQIVQAKVGGGGGAAAAGGGGGRAKATDGAGEVSNGGVKPKDVREIFKSAPTEDDELMAQLKEKVARIDAYYKAFTSLDKGRADSSVDHACVLLETALWPLCGSILEHFTRHPGRILGDVHTETVRCALDLFAFLLSKKTDEFYYEPSYSFFVQITHSVRHSAYVLKGNFIVLKNATDRSSGDVTYLQLPRKFFTRCCVAFVNVAMSLVCGDNYIILPRTFIELIGATPKSHKMTIEDAPSTFGQLVSALGAVQAASDGDSDDDS